MNFEQNWMTAFNRTCRWFIQMVMSTEIDSKNAMEQNQTESETMAGGNKMPTNSTITRTDRHFDHVLRSKPATKIDSNSNNNDPKQGQSPLKNGDSLSLNPYELFQDGPNRIKSDCLSQVAHLRQLLLLHLELIQQQQEQIQNKDKELNRLKLEKEQLESRLHRMDRRAAMKRKRSDIYDEETVVPEKTVQPVKLITPKSRRISVEQMIRSKRVPATASVTMTSGMCEDIGYETNMRTELLYLHNHPTASSLSILEAPVEITQRNVKEVSVPTWCINEITPPKFGKGSVATRNSSSSTTGEVECLDDEVFSKRHSKQEADEKRRKRWDIQQYRAQRLHESLEKKHREREDARLKGRKSRGEVSEEKETDDTTDMSSFLPSVNNVMALEVSDTVPVVAFGAAVPLCRAREFDLPWFSLDKRELQERKGKGKPSRGGWRGRGRGRGGRGRGRYKSVFN